MREAEPACRCHGKPMLWHKMNDGRPSGGTWRCAVKHETARQRYKAGHIETRIAGIWQRHRVPPSQKAEVIARLAAFRAQQQDEVMA